LFSTTTATTTTAATTTTKTTKGNRNDVYRQRLGIFLPLLTICG